MTVRHRCSLVSVLIVVLGVPALSQAQATNNRRPLVAAIKQQVLTAGIDLNHGPEECGRFEITKRVAWALRAEGVGLIAKFGAQNGCSAVNTTSEPKYSVDSIIWPDGSCIDIIGLGAEGPNTPMWLSCASTASLWRAPFDPGDAPPLPPQPPTPTPTPPPSGDLAAIRQRLDQMTQSLYDLARAVNDVQQRQADLQNRQAAMSTTVEATFREEQIDSQASQQARDEAKSTNDTFGTIFKKWLPAIMAAVFAGRFVWPQ